MFGRPSWSMEWPPLAFGAGLALAVTAWIAATPPGQSSDEVDHYARLISVGNGQLLGAPVQTLRDRFENRAEATSFLLTTRTVDLPPRLATPPAWKCLAADHASSAACVVRAGPPGSPAQLTGQGTRPPFMYFFPGWVADLLAGDPVSALVIGRVLFGVCSLGLLLLATWMCWDVYASSLVGLALAISPTVLWTTGLVNPSGPEIGAGILLAAAAVRLGRGSAGLRTGWWAATTAGAVVLATARPSGPAWLVLYAVLFLVQGRPAGLRAAISASPREAVVLGVVAAAGVAGNVAWQLHVPPAGVSPTIAAIVQHAGPAILAVLEAAGEEIGVFGSNDILMPRLAYAAWGGALVLVISVALLKGKRREVRQLEAVVASSFAVRWAFGVLFLATAGSLAQGRHLLPVTAAVAVMAGETVHRNREHIGHLRAFQAVVALLVGGVQFVGWYTAAHRFAVGRDGSWWIFPVSQWAPPLGWLPWTAILAAGCGLFVAAVVGFPRAIADRTNAASRPSLPSATGSGG